MLLSYFLRDFEYYNAPEGEDPAGKVIGFAKWGALYAGGMAIMDGFLGSKCQNARQFMNCLGYWVVPVTGMCVTFSSVAYIMCKLRKKDSHINYLAGTWAAGYVFHNWIKVTPISIGVTLCLSVLAIIKKDTEYYNQERVMEFKEDPWTLEWYNLPNRQWLFPPRFNHIKDDYWTNY